MTKAFQDEPFHCSEYTAMKSAKDIHIQSVWRVTGSPFTGAHCATFPPELIEPIILASCPQGGLVFDPFGGSGTVGLVCREHGRNFLLCDISQENVELARKRVLEGVTRNDKKRLLNGSKVQLPLPLPDTVQMIEEIVPPIEQDLKAAQPAPRPRLRGLWEGLDISDEDFTEVRAELWGDFPRKDIKAK
jgi:hypothetical protein